MRLHSTLAAFVAVLLALLALVPACSDAPLPPEKRTVEDKTVGFRYIAPPRWLYLGDELRSRHASLFTYKVLSLEGGDRKWIAGLPQTLLPQLEGWTKFFYVLDGKPETKPVTIGGLPALEVVHPVRTRPADPPTSVMYWIVRHEEQVYVLRATFPPGARAQDEPDIRSLLSTWTFLPPARRGESAPGLGFSLATPAEGSADKPPDKP